ncbi:MAG TPA: ABC transporter substrate-binding protein [Methanomassiliicoccales archaeon]|nr:ABC transporter substrate-binding protein [Methanomassiliicoccales archaeon]
MVNKIVTALVVLVIVAAGGLGALVLLTQPPEDKSIGVSFTSPTDGSTVSGNMHVAAKITSKAQIRYAALTLDGNLVSNLTAAPFNWTVNTANIEEGQHILNLSAANEAGTNGGAHITITVNNGGTTVGILAPLNTSHVSGNTTITTEVVSPRGIRYVSLSLDSVEFANLTSPPYSASWNTSEDYDGSHTLTARAVDVLNMTGTASVTVVVDNPFTYVDVNGNAVSFPRIPQRIVTLGNSFTEVVFAVGAGMQLAGRDSLSTYPAEALSVTDVGGTYGGSINKEAIIATNPDMIIVWGYNMVGLNPNPVLIDLQNSGYKIVGLYPKSITDVLHEISDIGNITGHPREGQALVDSMVQRINAAVAKVPDLPISERPKVYFELRNGKTCNNNTMSGQIIALAGGLNIYGNASLANPVPSNEVTISRMPQIIVVENQSLVANADIAARPGWNVIPAVQNDDIYRINGEWMTASPRLVNAIEQMVEWFYSS